MGVCQEKFLDTKGVISERKTDKNITQKRKGRVIRIPLETEGELGCSGGMGSSSWRPSYYSSYKHVLLGMKKAPGSL